MAIHLDTTAYNGVSLTYGRVTDITMDYQTRQSTVVLCGYPSRAARRGGYPPEQVMTAEFEMPDPPPEDMVAYVYAQLAQQYPEVDWAEV